MTKKLAWMFFIPIIMISCKRNELVTPDLKKPSESMEVMRSTPPEVDYFFNNTKVSSSSLNLEDTTLNVIINNGEDGKVSIFAYSTLAGYVSKGNSLGLNLQLYLTIEANLRNYAQSIGAIDLFDQTGVVDPAYTAYEAAYLASIPQVEAGQSNKTVVGGVWFDDIWSGTSPSTIYPSVSPFMLFGAWSNRVSSFTPLFL